MVEAIDDEAVAPDPITTVSRPWRGTVVVGLGVWLAAAAIVYLLVAMPLYFLSSLEPNGRDRPFVRDGLLVYGPVLSVVIGLVTGVVAAHWYRSGQTWALRTADSPTTRR